MAPARTPDAQPEPVAGAVPATLSALVLTFSWVDSPIGPLTLATDDQGRVRGVSFGDGLGPTMRREYPAAASVEGEPPPALAAALAAFFSGDRAALSRVPRSLDGARSASAADGFQPAVWRALAAIPCGTTISYGEIARRAGQPGAAQAAGVALNRNPLPLVLPCHRVVGADGAMVGFGGGLERKTWLLQHEGALLI
ncbi:MAG TPA: methylated-DNA--[protein]-cysteine S-methyltransferase [Brevundimonas sp.]|nr:methylated-DNA--[protein]-cysteine S-methyltransferase [Brevundimonas sp.]